MLNSRREFIRTTAMGFAGGALLNNSFAQIPGDRPQNSPEVQVLNPQNRVPLSFIIDDSTPLVNLAHFGIPQFNQVFPDRYPQPWRSLPREIPDAFVRKFNDWSREHGVKGKYSVVPYPGCVGWIDREMPGWSKKELVESLALIRGELASNWDFHPEMISHTRVIDTKTGRPYEEYNENFMENWGWTAGKSVDELANYIAYALQILHNVDLPCEGMTTPGGFGNQVLPELAQATLQACRSVYNTEIPHYFRHLFTDDTSVAPRVEYASGLDSDDPKCVVSIIGCTGDWFGGWDGLEVGSVDLLITQDLQKGRMVEVIKRGEPAIMVCHWPGIYFNGQEIGFSIFKEAVRRLHEAYDNLIWMKNSEIARYWAAKELTRLTLNGSELHYKAPFACPGFTVQVNAAPQQEPRVQTSGGESPLREVNFPMRLQPGTYFKSEQSVTLCFDLPKGEGKVVW